MKKVLLSFLFVAPYVWSCSCMQPPSLETIIPKADAVFHGEVISHLKDKSENYAVVKILNVYKDKVNYKNHYADNQRIHLLRSSNASSMCGVSLKAKPGQKFVLIIDEAPKSNGYPAYRIDSNVNSCSYHLFAYDNSERYMKILKLVGASN